MKITVENAGKVFFALAVAMVAGVIGGVLFIALKFGMR